MKFLHSGFRSKSFLTQNENILLVGQNAAAYPSYQAMDRTLRALEGQISTVQIPAQLTLCPPDDHQPFGALQYKYIPGNVLTEAAFQKSDLQNIAAQLGLFLRELHATPIAYIAPEFDPALYIAGQRTILARNIAALKSHIGRQQYGALTHWYQKFDSYLQTNDTFCLIHGDLWYENYIVSPDYKTLVGVVDWENTQISDPAQDFCALTYLGDDFVNQALRSYGARKKPQPEQVLLWRQHREITGFSFVLEYCDPSEIQEQLQKIRDVGVF